MPKASTKPRLSPGAPGALLTSFDEAAFLMEEITRALRREFERRIQETGLSRTQWRLLVYLLRSQGMTQTELARCLELERATVGQTVDRLEERGLVERRICQSDRRIWRVHVLDAARAIIPKMRAEADSVYDAAWEGITASEFKTLHDQLRTIASNLACLTAKRESGGNPAQ